MIYEYEYVYILFPVNMAFATKLTNVIPMNIGLSWFSVKWRNDPSGIVRFRRVAAFLRHEGCSKLSVKGLEVKFSLHLR